MVVKKEWEEAKKQEGPKPPSSGGSSLQVAWLREQVFLFTTPSGSNLHQGPSVQGEFVNRE
jgi:hypothetical protein